VEPGIQHEVLTITDSDPSRFSRRRLLQGSLALAAAATVPAAALASDPDVRRAALARWNESLPTLPPPELTRHGLAATELGRWHVLEARQAAMADADHFYGIGNHVLVKHRKQDGARVAQWLGPVGGSIIHFNAGYVDGNELVLAHSNFPQLPMASSIEVHDATTLQPLRSHSLGIRHGSLTWAVRHGGRWWACFAHYNERGGTPGLDQRWTHLGEFDDNWQMLRSWLFPPPRSSLPGDATRAPAATGATMACSTSAATMRPSCTSCACLPRA
jgi:hypothetical protein